MAVETKSEHWHIGKEIPIALVLGIIAQTMMAIWWASGVSTELSHLSDDVNELRKQRYTQNDYTKDAAVMSQRIVDAERRLAGLEEKRGR